MIYFYYSIAYLTLVILAGIAFAALVASKNKKCVEYSFQETLSKCRLPIVSFMEGDIVLNFLIDSGSTDSFISESASKMLLGTPIESYEAFATGGGEISSSKKIDVVLSDGNKEYKQELFINKNMDASFYLLYKSSGISVHGLLGSDFLTKYNFCIDFKSNTLNLKK